MKFKEHSEILVQLLHNYQMYSSDREASLVALHTPDPFENGKLPFPYYSLTFMLLG